VVLSGLFELRKVGDGSVPLAGTAVATVVSFVVGYALDRLAAEVPGPPLDLVFVYYRVALGGILFGLLAAGAIAAT